MLLSTLTGIIGVFIAFDLFLFYFFWELMLIPMFFLISLWGHEKRRAAAVKFFIFTQLSGLLMLASILELYFAHGRQSGIYTFDYFALFGLEPKLSVDSDDLERRFYSLSRELHPDLFQQATPAERQMAEETTARLNDAYRMLRNPISRAEYVLKQNGLSSSDARKVPPEMLDRVFDLNETLEEFRTGDKSVRGSIETAWHDLLAEMTIADATLDQLFAAYDSGDPKALADIRALLDRRRYISNLLDQIDREVSFR
jgi:Fe-S protein assembly co-chaperone HscB